MSLDVVWHGALWRDDRPVVPPPVVPVRQRALGRRTDRYALLRLLHDGTWWTAGRLNTALGITGGAVESGGSRLANLYRRGLVERRGACKHFEYRVRETC